MTKETLKIQGMSCGHCVKAVEEALREVAGLEVWRVDIGSAEVEYPAESVPRARIVSAIEEAGYQVMES